MIIRLQHPRTDGDVDTYHLKSGRRYHIGRGSACEVRILDLKLSRKHCAVEYNEGEWRCIDLASTNGCKVDGDQIVGSVPLKVGTQIEIGQTTLKVVRILGDDEVDDEDEAGAAAPSLPAARQPTPLPLSEQRTPPPETRTPLPANGSDTHPKLEQVQLPQEERSGPVEHIADDWEPEPEPEHATKTGALEPNRAADAQADEALAAARRAAEKAAKPGSSGTGEIQKPARPAPPALEKSTPRAELPTTKPAADSSSSQYRKTPVPRQPTPLPAAVPEIESGPYKSLEPQPPARAAAAREARPAPAKPSLELDEPAPAPPPAPETPAKQPGTETRRRQKVMPVIVQPMSDDELAATVPAAPPAPAPTLPSAPPMAAAPPMAKAPEPVRPAPVAPKPADEPKPAAAAGGDDRTFYITVLGRRVGPLTRALARDLKARELKGTLTLKDLDQYN